MSLFPKIAQFIRFYARKIVPLHGIKANKIRW